MTLNVQFLTMLFMVVSGFYLGIALETFRRFSPLWRHRPVLVYIFVVGFWCVLRLYLFFACLLGFSIYQALAAPLYRVVLEHIIRLLTAIARALKRLCHILILSPVGWLVRLILWGVWLVLWVLIHLTFVVL